METEASYAKFAGAPERGGIGARVGAGAAMAAHMVKICAIYQKGIFYLSHFAAGLPGL